MPAHHPGAHRFGALYAANSHLPSENGEEPLRKNRLIFQLLAAELLNWYARQEKALALKNSGLTTLDLQILNAIARGQRLDSIAEDLDISLHALRRRHVRSINTKLKTKTIVEAARLASEQGFLAIASERKVGYVIHSARCGTLLRQDYGIPFWSDFNPAGLDDAQVQVVAAPDGLDVPERLGEVVLGVEEHDLDVGHDLRREVDEDAVLERRRQDEPVTEPLRAPFDGRGRGLSAAI